MYDIQLFGPLTVRTRGVRLAGRDFGGVKPRHILALLALHGAMHKAELTELLWDGRPPANHVATVESYVSLLRHRLDPTTTARDSVITTSNGGYVLVADQVRVDVARFDELVAAASGRTAARALPPLTAAAHLATSPLLSDEQSGWISPVRSMYRDRLVGALLEAGGHALATGQANDALVLSARAVALDPVAERGWFITMAAHRELGDRVAALRAYDRCRRELCDGLGVEPSAETRALFLSLLRAEENGTMVDEAVAAVLAAARSAERPENTVALLRRAAELAV
jgi:DNA-binding SARP family transcriptional activator